MSGGVGGAASRDAPPIPIPSGALASHLTASCAIVQGGAPGKSSTTIGKKTGKRLAIWSIDLNGAVGLNTALRGYLVLFLTESLKTWPQFALLRIGWAFCLQAMER